MGTGTEQSFSDWEERMSFEEPLTWGLARGREGRVSREVAVAEHGHECGIHWADVRQRSELGQSGEGEVLRALGRL